MPSIASALVKAFGSTTELSGGAVDAACLPSVVADAWFRGSRLAARVALSRFSAASALSALAVSFLTTQAEA